MRGHLSPDSPEVADFVTWLERENDALFGHYLVWLVLNEHLARPVKGSPIME